MTSKGHKRKLNPVLSTEESSTENPRPKKRVTFSTALNTTETYQIETEEESDDDDLMSDDSHTSWADRIKNDLDPIHDIQTLTNTALNSGVYMEEMLGGMIEKGEKKNEMRINGEIMDDKGTKGEEVNEDMNGEEMEDQEVKDEEMKDRQEYEYDKECVSKNSSIHEPPTNEEIRGLKETTDLFKSNIFKLQIDELLSEISIDFTATSRLENALNKLKQIFENMNDKLDLPIDLAKSILSKKYNITIPFPDPDPTCVQYKFGFKKPTAFYLVGSYPLKGVIRRRQGFNVDVAVIMPKSIFQEKDYMNY
ncbi:14309_t:CDS:2, partial [Acaulospora morrowiae]